MVSQLGCSSPDDVSSRLPCWYLSQRGRGLCATLYDMTRKKFWIVERKNKDGWARCSFKQWERRKDAAAFIDDVRSNYLTPVEFRVSQLPEQKSISYLLRTDERSVKESQRDPGPR